MGRRCDRRQGQQRGDQAFHGSNIVVSGGSFKGWRAPTPLVGRAPEPRGSCREGGMHVWTRSADEHRSRRLAETFRKRECRRAEAAFGQCASDNPVCAATARAMINLIFPIHSVISTPCRIKSGYVRSPHCRSSSLVRTSDESLGFNDKLIRKPCHQRATFLSRRGTGNPLWILTITLPFGHRLCRPLSDGGGG